MEVEAEAEADVEPVVAEPEVVAPAKKAAAVVAPVKADAAKSTKKAGKKSSTIGSGGAGKKAKDAIMGKKA
jgi:ribosome biogenesis protein UTP30